MKSSNNSIACPLAQAAVQFPDMPALESSVRQVTYKQYHNCVGTIAERLASEGVHSGDRVAIVAETCIEYVMLLMAIIRSGAIACPLSLRNPASLLKEQIASLNAKTVVQDRDLPDGISSKECHSMAIGQLCHNHDLNSKPDMNVRLPLDCDASILFTSGSANKPKAVVHTIGNHYYSALGSNENINLAPGDRWMLSLPLYHVGGLAVPFRAMLAGAAVFVPSCGHDSLAEEIAVSGITHLSIVPAQLSRLLDQMNSTNTRLPQLKAVLVGGDAVGPAMVA
ncbi:MAG: AMP-binding protein, partial [Candidatus Zixiibacteriota bacterium]